MLKIRLNRTGKKKQPSYRVVVQEHTAPLNGKFVEVLGFYRPADNPKVFKVDMERINHWLSVGAQPSPTVAVMLKKEGMKDMDKYLTTGTKTRKKKKAPKEPAPQAPAASAPAEPAAPAEEPAATATE